MKTQINILNVTNISDLFNFSVVKYIAFDIEKCRDIFFFWKEPSSNYSIQNNFVFSFLNFFLSLRNLIVVSIDVYD